MAAIITTGTSTPDVLGLLSSDVGTTLEIIMENAGHPLMGPALIPVVFTAVFTEIRCYREKVSRCVDIDQVARTSHEQWLAGKVQTGFHHPDACPHQPKEGNRGCPRCHLDMKKWEDLNEHVKGRKRNTVRSILDAIGVTSVRRKEVDIDNEM